MRGRKIVYLKQTLWDFQNAWNEEASSGLEQL